MSDKVLPAPSKPLDGVTKPNSPELPPTSVQINSAEWQAANAKHQEGKGQTAGCCDCNIVGKLDEKETAKTVEQLSKATNDAGRLSALGKLADGGIDKFSMKDKDGTTRQFRIETEKIAGTTLLHCYGLDEQKEEQVVFRAARSADGTFKQERNKDDQLVSFTGDTWSKSMSGKSFLVGEVQKTEQNKKTGDSEKVGDKKSSKTSTTSGEHSKGKIASSHDDSPRKSRTSEGGKSRASHDEEPHRKARTQESHGRDRHRDDDDRTERRGDKHTKRDGDHREKSGSRFNLGETLGTVARYVAPFLLSALERNQYRDCNPYRNQHEYRSSRGHNDYYGRNDYERYERYDSYNQGRSSGHCGNDYDRRYGNRNYYDSHRQNGQHRNRHSSNNWLSRLIGS